MRGRHDRRRYARWSGVLATLSVLGMVATLWANDFRQPATVAKPSDGDALRPAATADVKDGAVRSTDGAVRTTDGALVPVAEPGTPSQPPRDPQPGPRPVEPRPIPMCSEITLQMLPDEDQVALRALRATASVYPDGVASCAEDVDLLPLSQADMDRLEAVEIDEPATFDLDPTWAPPPGYENLTDLPIEPLPGGIRCDRDGVIVDPKSGLAKCTRGTLQGWADLHTHMFAELAWPGTPGSGSTFVEGTVEGSMVSALPRCSGATDHATIKPGYGSGLGIASEGLTAVGGTLAFALSGVSLGAGSSKGDSGMHLHRRNGWDTRQCVYACRGPLGCQWQPTQAACFAADPTQCKDNVPNNISVSALLACNTKPNEASCDGSGYCGSINSTLWSVADDLSPCWSHYPNCDNGDMCIKRDPLKSLECNDLSQTECNNHGAECDWHSECKHGSGMLECNDLNQTECNNHGSECDWHNECKHVAGMLECNDLSHSECDNHSECHWSNFWGSCKWDSGSLTCSDLNPTECANHWECSWQQECRHPLFAPSLECNDLNSTECTNHDNECDWEEKCKHPLFAPPLECSDLNLQECANHWVDGGCGARDCFNVNCHWHEGCTWDPIWPPHCGQHFREWPAWDTPTHQQHWWGWVQDAYRRGLRVLSVSLLESHPLAKLFPAFAKLPHDVILDQIAAAHQFVALHPWAEIALDPAHARTIVEGGRLALVLTIEGEFPFCTQEPCGEGPDEEDIGAITTILDEYHSLGVRGMQIVGHFDNPYGGVANYVAAIHSLQWIYEELSPDGIIQWSDFTAATPTSIATIDTIVGAAMFPYTGGIGPISGSFPIVGFGAVNDIHTLAAIMGKVVGNDCVIRGTTTPKNCSKCLSDDTPCDAVRATTPIGLQLVQALVDRHWLIDISHLSDAGTREVDQFLSTFPDGVDYPLYVSHGDPREALRTPEQHMGAGGHKGPHQEKPTPDEIFDIIRERKGMFGVRTGPDEFVDVPSSGVANDCAGSTKSFAQSLAYVVEQDVPVGFAVDMNGMIQNAAPRFRTREKRSRQGACLGNTAQQIFQHSPVADDPSTPFTNEAEFNIKGLGHIGFLGAFVDDLQQIGLAPQYRQALEESAEQFVAMWERTQ